MVVRNAEAAPPPVGPADGVKEVIWDYPFSPEEVEKSRTQREEFERNAAIFDRMVPEIYATYRGQFACVAGGELFVGLDSREVQTRAEAAHPDTVGAHYHRYIRRKHEAGHY